MRRPVAGPNQGDTPQEWFASLPIVTKSLMLITFGLTCAASFGLINPMNFIFQWPLVVKQFHIWRVITGCLFAGGFSFNFLIHMFMLYQISISYELSAYNTGAGGTSADYLWMAIIGMVTLCIADSLFMLNPLSDAFLYYVMYVRARRSPEYIMNMWGFKFKALYMPFMYVGLRLLMGNSIKSCIAGILIGHLYYFLVDTIPITQGFHIIKTPAICSDIVSYATGRTQPASVTMSGGQMPASRTQPATASTTYGWGRGRTLGAN